VLCALNRWDRCVFLFLFCVPKSRPSLDEDLHRKCGDFTSATLSTATRRCILLRFCIIARTLLNRGFSLARESMSCACLSAAGVLATEVLSVSSLELASPASRATTPFPVLPFHSLCRHLLTAHVDSSALARVSSVPSSASRRSTSVCRCRSTDVVRVSAASNWCFLLIYCRQGRSGVRSG